jgi:hypothetical protein
VLAIVVRVESSYLGLGVIGRTVLKKQEVLR